MNFNGRTNVVSERCVDWVVGSAAATVFQGLIVYSLSLLLLLNKCKGIFHILYVLSTHLSATTCCIKTSSL